MAQKVAKVEELNEDDRSDLIEHLVRRRAEGLEYVKRVYESRSHWLNTVVVSERLLGDLYALKDEQKRITQWFCLGVSAANLLKLQNGSEYVRAMGQLLEEYDYAFGGMAAQGYRMVRNALGSEVKTKDGIDIRPQIRQAGGSVQYLYLQRPNIPFGLHYRHVVVSLCEVLVLGYRKFMHETVPDPVLCDAVVRIDKKLKHQVLSPMSRDLSKLAEGIIEEQINTLLLIPPGHA
eukprot:comp15484_c0_seq1/m.23612 comp15484_c0_seq1/g.23612  ORF comp15484_c0_seq1/g.23612 comp15484_c0_seq1/m.23612 type:complete len:234 (-) comp15484_c0_seq1:67-768(-)